MSLLHFTLLDASPSLVEEWKCAFTKYETVSITISFIQSRLADLVPPESHFDCIVSPANSYGRLDGGFDYYLSEALAPPNDLLAPTQLVQTTLYRRWKGYAPPGTCTLVSLSGSVCENNSHGCAFIAICPTMRIPETVVWNREIVYNCVWSLLVAIDEHNRCVQAAGTSKRINKVLMTGLGTGVGGVSARRCAEQMALAMRDFADASAHPEKWSSMQWDDAISYARDGRDTHQL